MSDPRAIPFGRPSITEEDRAAVAAVLDTPILTHGPQCRAFEEEFAAFLGPGAHCVTVSSCMAALHLACLRVGFGPGDDVLVPAQTHAATAHAVEWVGARPVFADCDPCTGNVTADTLARALTPRTRGIVLVHFVGIPCEMGDIVGFAHRRGLPVVEDCALAVGSRWRGTHVGLLGDAGCFSFYPVKHMTTGEGGMFVSRDAETASAVARLRAFGVERSGSAASIPGAYDVPSLGLNYRMGEMQAALGRSQLLRVPAMLEARRARFERLCAALQGLPGVRVLDSASPDCASSHYCLSLVLGRALARSRDDIVRSLNAHGIGTSVYYPHPVPRLDYYRNRYALDPEAYREAARLSDASIALPVAPHVSLEGIDRIADAVSEAVKEVQV
ncbi:MAG: DegT/DnrJ/EryC1/StrS aminotransferase family protein [Chthonomonadales bacterium]|nr:DegT/DnrJ/EryC1/StrS aminotransferase family protein [Chthonomonadales bacterium]